MSDRFDLVITGGTIVTGAGRRRADVAINAGRFAAFAGAGTLAANAEQVLDAAGQFVLPGLIDGHVHFRQPGLETKEDWLTGSRAAAMGGITTVLEMPNTLPPTADVAAARAKAELATASAHCDFGLIGLLGAGNVDDLAGLVAAGLVRGLKVFMAPTTGGLSVPDARSLERGLSLAREAGLRVVFHAEASAAIERAESGLRRIGRRDALAHLASRPAEAEASAIEQVGELLARSHAAGHVAHLSSAAGLAALEKWRSRGIDLTCEVTAHHILLGRGDYARLGSLVKCNPPVRGEPDGSALLAALADGRIDAIASDHAPHAPEDKSGGDIWAAAAGIAGVETSLPLLLTAVFEGLLSLERLAAAFAEAPARIWGLAGKGRLEIGADGDATIIDPARIGVIRGRGLHGKHGLTPFEGWHTVGAAVASIVRGQLVMSDGDLVGRPGWGRMAG